MADQDRITPGTGTYYPAGEEELPILRHGVHLYDVTLAWISHTWGVYENMPAQGKNLWFHVLRSSRRGLSDKKARLQHWARWVLSTGCTEPIAQKGISDWIRLSVAEAARYVNVNDRTIRNWYSCGKLDAIKDSSGNWLFSKSSLQILRDAR